MSRTLPTHRGLTVDERLQEFRYFDADGNIERISFNCIEGALLYAEYRGDIELTVIRRQTTISKNKGTDSK